MGESIYIVSGLPRSGTTMMMHMLLAGGMPIVADNLSGCEDVRTNDLQHNNTWLSDCAGKAIKVLFPQVLHVPSSLRYKIIWMVRDLKQQAKSMKKFLSFIGRPSTDRAHKLAKRNGQRQMKVLAALRRQENIDLHVVDFAAVLADPRREAKALFSFVQFPGFDWRAAADVVLPRDEACLSEMYEVTIAAETDREAAQVR